MGIKEEFDKLLAEHNSDYNICGVVSSEGNIYPIGSDTKVLSTIFELFARPLIQEYVSKNGYIVQEPDVQNHYPDFTLMRSTDDKNKIAIDVKTTYVNVPEKKFKYTLGGYTSFIRSNTKNIVFPFDQYSEHWVLGFVYTRVAVKKAAAYKIYSVEDISKVELPYKDVKVFFQEKWKISGDKAGSGNTTNIGSISGTIEDFNLGNGPFQSESEFLDYWRNYERTASERDDAYSNIHEYREWIARANFVGP